MFSGHDKHRQTQEERLFLNSGWRGFLKYEELHELDNFGDVTNVVKNRSPVFVSNINDIIINNGLKINTISYDEKLHNENPEEHVKNYPHMSNHDIR